MSRSPRPFSVFGFASTHDALDAEALLLDLGVDVVVMPAPKSLGSLCGLALRLEIADETRALDYLQGAGLSVRAREVIEDV